MLNGVISIVRKESVLVRVYIETVRAFKIQNVVICIGPIFKNTPKNKRSNKLFAAKPLLKTELQNDQVPSSGLKFASGVYKLADAEQVYILWVLEGRNFQPEQNSNVYRRLQPHFFYRPSCLP